MTTFFKNIKEEINSKRRVYIPTIIIFAICIVFSLIYTGFRMSQDSNSDILMRIMIPIISLIFFVFLFSSLIYIIHKIPAMKPLPFALLLSTFFTLVTVGKFRNYDINIYLQIIIYSLVFITIFIVSYKFKK